MHDSVKKNILFFTIVSIVCLSFLISQIWNISYIYILTTSIILLIPVFFFSYYYSVLPIRAKAKPFLDGLFNILYIVSPFILYIFFQEFYKYPIGINTVYIFIASYAWTIALHFYSAIPDIYADAQAWLRTTAVYLGKSWALIYCGILYLIATVLSYPTLGWFSVIGWCIYIGMMVISYRYDDIFWLYKKFPLINLIVGFALFWYIVLVL
jgi:4-hydroxybenzoate polyprenyltransferase